MKLCACGCREPVETDNVQALYASEACKTRAYRDRQAEAAQAGRVTPQTRRKRVADMTQVERVERALTLAGPKGITQISFDLPHVVDGGAPIKRVAARVQELRDQGHPIVSRGRRQKCTIYVLEPTGQLFSLPDREPAEAAA